MKKAVQWLFFLFLIVFPFGVLAGVSTPIRPEVRLYLIDFLVGTVAIAGLWSFRKEGKKSFQNQLFKPWLVFSLIAFISLAWAKRWLLWSEWLVSGAYLLRWLAYGGFYFALSQSKEMLSLKKRFADFLLVLGGFVAVFGFCQYLFWPNLKPLEIWQWDPHFYRLVGSFLDPGFIGLILVFSLILALAVLLEGKKKGALALIGILLVALSLTWSRGSALALFAGGGYLLWRYEKKRLLLLGVVVLSLSWLLLPQPTGAGGSLWRTYTIKARQVSWQQAVDQFKRSPFLGIGFNAYRYRQQETMTLTEGWQESHSGAGVDNSFLLVLATTGLAGATAFGWLSVKIWQRAKQQPVLAASLIALAIHACFQNSLFFPWVMGWMAVLLASE